MHVAPPNELAPRSIFGRMGVTPKWSHAAFLARTRLPLIASLVPVLGYAVLWSDAFNQSIMRLEALGHRQWFDPLTRIEFLYTGGVMVLAGMIVFWLRCPWQLRTFTDRTEYSSWIREGLQSNEAARAGRAVRRLTGNAVRNDANAFVDGVELSEGALAQAEKGSTEVPSIFCAHFVLLDLSRSFSCLSCLVLLTVGGVVFAVPSIEVLCAAIPKIVVHVLDVAGLPWSGRN